MQCLLGVSVVFISGSVEHYSCKRRILCFHSRKNGSYQKGATETGFTGWPCPNAHHSKRILIIGATVFIGCLVRESAASSSDHWRKPRFQNPSMLHLRIYSICNASLEFLWSPFLVQQSITRAKRRILCFHSTKNGSYQKGATKTGLGGMALLHLPTDMEAMERLKIIHLNRCLVLKWFFQLQNLMELTLTYNHSSSADFRGLEKIPNLTNLQLGCNCNSDFTEFPNEFGERGAFLKLEELVLVEFWHLKSIPSFSSEFWHLKSIPSLHLNFVIRKAYFIS